MKYKILKGTESFDKIVEIFSRSRECHKAALNIALRYNKEGKYLGLGDGDVLGGGMSAVFFDTKPEGWIADKHYQGAYRPNMKKKENAEIITEIKSLPVVMRKELNDVLNFEGGFIGNKYYYGCAVNYKKSKDYILVAIQSELKKYKPTDDMIEILSSEYNKLEAGMDK